VQAPSYGAVTPGISQKKLRFESFSLEALHHEQHLHAHDLRVTHHAHDPRETSVLEYARPLVAAVVNAMARPDRCHHYCWTGIQVREGPVGGRLLDAALTTQDPVSHY